MLAAQVIAPMTDMPSVDLSLKYLRPAVLRQSDQVVVQPYHTSNPSQLLFNLDCLDVVGLQVYDSLMTGIPSLNLDSPKPV